MELTESEQTRARKAGTSGRVVWSPAFRATALSGTINSAQTPTAMSPSTGPHHRASKVHCICLQSVMGFLFACFVRSKRKDGRDEDTDYGWRHGVNKALGSLQVRRPWEASKTKLSYFPLARETVGLCFRPSHSQIPPGTRDSRFLPKAKHY